MIWFWWLVWLLLLLPVVACHCRCCRLFKEMTKNEKFKACAKGTTSSMIVCFVFKEGLGLDIFSPHV